MLQLDKLILSGIGRFVEEQTIDFSSLGNLVQLDGIRNDTGGSSGSGKSTALNALDYVLGLNDIPSSVLQSRLTKEGILVSFVGKYKDRPLTITRGKGKLSVDLNGEITTGSKLAEEKIDQMLGMPRNLFRPLLHKRQKEGGFFLQFSPKEIHEFLTDCLGLGEIRKKQELVDTKTKSVADDLTHYNNELNKSKSALEANQNSAKALGDAPVREMTQETVVRFKKAADEAQALLAPIRQRQALEVSTLELQKPELRSTVMDTAALDAAQAELATINLQINATHGKHAHAQSEERQRASGHVRAINDFKVDLSRHRYEVSSATAAKVEAAKAALEVKKIRDSVCPTCEQNWATDAATAREIELLEKIKNYKDLIVQGAKAEREIVAKDSKIEELRELAIEQILPSPTQLATLGVSLQECTVKIRFEKSRQVDFANAQHLLNKMAQDEFATKFRDLGNRHYTETQHVNGQAEVSRRAFEMAAQKMQSYEEVKSRYENTLSIITTEIDRRTLEVEGYTKSLTHLQDRLSMCEDLKKAIKGFTSRSFDEALDYIGTAATEIIRAIPNMATATIQLESTKETAAGKIKEEVNAVLSMDGETGIPIRSLSGGERSSVDLAVDLAVIDLLENRTNKGINLFILDEPFTGLDTVSIEMAIEKLKSLNKRLVIVDHNPEIKEMVESRLVAVRDGLTSKIVQY